MAGFGKGPFGKEPFGEWKWSRQVLYDLVPELYRDNDPDGLFEAFTQALRPSFDKQRKLIRDFADLRVAFLIRTQFDERERLRLGPAIVPQGDIEQQGNDAAVDALFQFTTTTARFREADEGKELIVRGSTITGNNRKVTVIKVVSLSTVLTDPQLKVDAGPLKWELREKVSAPSDYITVEVRGGDVSRVTPGWILNDGRADFEVLARRQFDALGSRQFQTEREGSDGAISGDRFFSADSGNFTERDVGKYLSISGSLTVENNRRFQIVGYDTSSGTLLELRGNELTPDTDLHWAILPHPQLDLEGRATPLGVVEQEGEDGELFAGSDEFFSGTATFTDEDVGKILTVFRPSLAANPAEFEIIAIVDANTVQMETTNPVALTDVVWELRSATASSQTERSGNDLEIIDIDTVDDRRATVVSPTASFVPADEGHEIILTESDTSSNNDTYTIESVLSEDKAVITRGNEPSLPLFGDPIELDVGPLSWSIQEPAIEALAAPLQGQRTRVDLRAESLIKFFAPDFGIEIDNQESEDRQRSWVRHVNTWLDRKGHEDGYKIVGAISGFTVTVSQLYRLDSSFFGLFSSGELFEVGEADEGRSGSDGLLTTASGGLRFIADSAIFKPSDSGLSLRVGNSIDPANNKIYTLDTFIDENTYTLRVGDTISVAVEAGLPDLTASTLTWSLVRLYGNMPPTLPRFDDINADAMGEYIDANLPAGDAFTVDRYCWEDDWAAFVEVTVNSVTNVEGNRFLINVVPTSGVGDLDIIPHPDPGVFTKLDLPIWAMVDPNGNRFVVENIPDVVGGVAWEFEVVADPDNPPVTGVGTLNYECLEQASCGYCGASAVAVEIEEDSIAGEVGVAVERVLERVLARLVQHPKPAHVRLIPIFKRILEASLNITAEVEGPVYVQNLLAPLGLYFDTLGDADAVPLDQTILAEVEATKSIWEGGFS
jgi:hypothetical protein